MTCIKSESGYLSGFYNVELHHHLDGSVRLSTVCDLAQQYGIPFDADQFEKEVKNVSNLESFLDVFNLFLPIIQGRRDAIERVAYESVEDHYLNNVAYFETRLSPYGLLATDQCSPATSFCAHDAIQAVIDGLERGEKDFGVKSTIILCNLRCQVELLTPFTNLLKVYQHHAKVVGIDTAGDENLPWTTQELELTKNLYRVARALGYGCTFHAGEQGMVQNIELALDDIKTTRIGHGYALFKDYELTQRCEAEKVHFEYCPISSKTLNSLGTPFDDPKNPINLGLKHKINFSLNCDDALFFGNVGDSLKICKDVLDFSDKDLFQIRVNAARASFLPPSEKAKLVVHIMERQ